MCAMFAQGGCSRTVTRSKFVQCHSLMPQAKTIYKYYLRIMYFMVCEMQAIQIRWLQLSLGVVGTEVDVISRSL